jgi:hypothetical protein
MEWYTSIPCAVYDFTSCNKACTMQNESIEKLHKELAFLTDEHRKLDAEIHIATSQAGHSPLEVQRLKKRKLILKDKISLLETALIPNIIA